MVNAYVTWVKEMEDLGVRVGTHLGFKIVVGRHLIEDVFNNCAPPQEDNADQHEGGLHLLTHTSDHR